jgi:hypothetical protein
MSLRLLFAGALGLLLATTSCSTGPTPPQPGTPAFYWGAAQETWRGGDILKTNDTLQEITQSPNDFTERARTWDIVISAGMAQSLSDVSDAYEAGARANRANPTPFRKQVNTLRELASASNLQLAQAVHTFVAEQKTPDVAFAFEYPVGTANPPPGLKKIYAGMILQDSEADSLQTAMVERGVLLALCDFLGTPDDSAKALEKFKAGAVKVPREVFLMAAARALNAGASLYSPNKLDNPQRVRLLCEEALGAVHAIPETKETKALADKIQATLKKLVRTT